MLRYLFYLELLINRLLFVLNSFGSKRLIELCRSSVPLWNINAQLASGVTVSTSLEIIRSAFSLLLQLGMNAGKNDDAFKRLGLNVFLDLQISLVASAGSLQNGRRWPNG